MVTLVITEDDLSHAASSLVGGAGPVCAGVGISNIGEGLELACRGITLDPPKGKRYLRLQAEAAADKPDVLGTDRGELGQLNIGLGDEAGSAYGWVRQGGEIASISQIRVLGAGLPVIRAPGSAEPLSDQEREQWSRTIGVLGENTWQRLVSIRYAVVGVGRMGGLVAASLAQLGVRQITVVDPDLVGLSDLGEGGARQEDIGQPKVWSFARTCQQMHWPATIEAVYHSALGGKGLEALRGAEAIICCVDNDATRLGVAAVASAYLKPCLDIATGIGPETEGFDIRLTLGERCLACFGGLGDLDGARRALDTAMHGRVLLDWRRQRRGSLRPLNQVAAGVATKLWCDLVAGRTGSTWVRGDFGHDGELSVQYTAPGPAEACSVCANRGLGDAALARIRAR